MKCKLIRIKYTGWCLVEHTSINIIKEIKTNIKSALIKYDNKLIKNIMQNVLRSVYVWDALVQQLWSKTIVATFNYINHIIKQY